MTDASTLTLFAKPTMPPSTPKETQIETPQSTHTKETPPGNKSNESEVISYSSNIGDSSESTVLEGGAYVVNIDYLAPEDESLVNTEKIFTKVNQYIDNYNSPEYSKYKKLYNQIYQKYSKKQYIIQPFKHKIKVVKNTKVQETVIELNKPKYFHYTPETFILMERELSNQRALLKYNYDKLITKLDLKLDDKTAFEKERAKFIVALEKYYTYQVYHKKINKIGGKITMNILIQHLSEYLKESGEETRILLENEFYKIEKSLIDSINKFNGDRLTAYNDIIYSLQTKKGDTLDKKLKDKILEYLDKKELELLLENLNKTVKTQDEYVSYIVEVLPDVQFDE